MAANNETANPNNGAYAAAAASALSAGFAAGVSKKSLERQNKYNVENWNRVNEYNLPANQMQRYKDAGLNPNLIYGQGNSGNSTTPLETTATRSVPGVGISHISDNLSAGFNMLQQLKDLQIKDQQVRNMKADEYLKYASTDLTSTKNAMQELFNFGHQTKYAQRTDMRGETDNSRFPLWQRMGQNFKINENRTQLQSQDLAIKRLLGIGQGFKNTVLSYQADPYMYFGTSILRSMAPYLQKMPSLNRVTRSRR